MPKCYQCGNVVKSTDVKCNRCQAELKAFGHAGIELHRSTGAASLCLTCAYHLDDSCDYAKRPEARECTMYRDVNLKVETIHRPGARRPTPPLWGPTQDYPDAPQPFTAAWWQAHSWVGICLVILGLMMLLLMGR
jgi:hypothetical protein